jgi:hypothetical protein
VSERARKRLDKIEQALKSQFPQQQIVILYEDEPIPEALDLNADPEPLIIRIIGV